MKFFLSVIFLAVIFLPACAKKRSSGTGTYPTFTAEIAELIPAIPGTTTGTFAVAPRPNQHVIPLSLTYSQSDFNPTYDYTYAWDHLLDIMGSNLQGRTPKVSTKIMDLVDQLAGITSLINSTYSDTTGDAYNCTEVPFGTTGLTQPFFKENTLRVSEFSISDDNVYTCRFDTVSGTNTKHTIFGRQAGKESDATTSCTDNFDYYVFTGFNFEDTNTASVDIYGTKATKSQTIKATFNGCSKELTLVAAESTVFDDMSIIWGLRTEITGNTGTHIFKIRSGVAAGTTTVQSFFSVTAVGVSQGDGAHLILNYTNSASPQISKTFCLAPSTDGTTFTAPTDTSDCTTSHEYDYSQVTPFSLDAVDIPTVEFASAWSDFGLTDLPKKK